MDGAASSLARQTVRDFVWLVFFDSRTPGWLRDEIAELAAGLFTPLWLEDLWSHDAIRRAVIAVTDKPFLITTRLDSDDGVARTFVADVQAQFAEQDGLYVNFLRGVQVDRSGQVYRYDHLSNPFISYIEKRVPGVPPRTVWQNFGHGQSPRMGDLLEIIGPPRWLQVVHGSNLMNEVRGLRERPSVANRAFDLALPYERSVNPIVFAWQWVVSVGRRGALWVRSPGQAREYAHALKHRLAGTRVRARRSG